MFSLRSTLCILALSLMFACGSQKKKGKVSASLMKPTAVAASLALSEGFNLTATGSTAQSFTPSSLKIPIFGVNVCNGTSGCRTLYTCSANTVAGCLVELSKIDAFVDTLNASATEIEEGNTFDYIGVQFCPDGDSSGIQNITLNGTVKISGVDYATDPTSGLVAGTTGKDTSLKVNGGCASFYKMASSFTVSKDTPTTIKLFFDASLYAYGGISGGAASSNSYVSDGSCVGSSGAYVCVPVITVVPTTDSGTPTTQHYLVSNTDTSANSAPTAKVSLYFSSDGVPVGGVQNSYRISGSAVSWDRQMDGGLALFPKVVDATTVSFGEPEGSVTLANWFKAFKLSSHTGTYTYSLNGVATTGSYKATKL